jgi:prephenate dehydrogenase
LLLMVEIGIIGFGDMGRLYAMAFKRHGWQQ